MKTRKSSFPLASAVLLIMSCMVSITGCNVSNGDALLIDLEKFSTGEPLTEEMLDAISEETEHVELVADGDITVPSDPQGIKLHKDRIFILDNLGPRSFQMLAFGLDGKLVGKIGAPGRGPGEYFVITDFAVAPDGSLWINDAGTDNMLHFGKDLEHVGTYRTEYDMDRFEFLANGKILANVSQWDTELVEIAITDTIFTKEHRQNILHYRNEPHPLYGFGDGTLFRTAEGYIHNHPVDPDAYVLDSNTGEILRHYIIGTGSETLTYDDIADLGYEDDLGYDRLMKDHTFLSEVFFLSDRYIIGSIMEKGELVYFLADLDSRTIHKESSEDIDPISGYSDGWLISKSYPEKTEDHYKLILRKIN